MLRLVGTDGTQFYTFEITPGIHHVGRQETAGFCVPHKTVSRRHAEIESNRDGDECYLSDLGSHNGTVVNGERINRRTAIKPGDRIMFGQTEFKLTRAEDESLAAAALPRTRLAQDDPQNSVFLSIDEALRPLPRKVTDQPELLPTLMELAKMLVLTEPREVMLEKSLELLARIIPAERLAILFVSEDNNDVSTAASLLPGGTDPGELKLSKTIVTQIMANKSSILITDAGQDPRFAEQKSIVMSEMKSAMAVPLFDEGEVLGILYVDTSKPHHSYADDHLRVLATFGNIIASRLLNYSLVEERQEKQVIERELQRASSIQKALLVTSPPQIEGYLTHACQEQSRSVGGDLYDVKLLPDGCLYFMVADVSGKGMGAALLMSNILASFRILYDSEDFDLATAVRRVSLQLYSSSAPGDFATLFAGIIDPRRGTIRYVNAGHNPPLLVRTDGSFEYCGNAGVMIGAFDFPTWEQEVVEIRDGDLLFIFSDGVTEAERDGNQYGDERMEKLVVKSREMMPREMAACLMDDINGFMGDAPRSDDITMLIIKKEKP